MSGAPIKASAPQRAGHEFTAHRYRRRNRRHLRDSLIGLSPREKLAGAGIDFDAFAFFDVIGHLHNDAGFQRGRLVRAVAELPRVWDRTE